MSRQHLTTNACTLCRRKRTKCDGQIPCKRCDSRGEECLYEDRIWRTKDYLRSEIEKLRKEQQHLRAILRAVIPDCTGDQWKAVMARNESPEEIGRWVRSMSRAEFPVSGRDKGLCGDQFTSFPGEVPEPPSRNRKRPLSLGPTMLSPPSITPSLTGNFGCADTRGLISPSSGSMDYEGLPSTSPRQDTSEPGVPRLFSPLTSSAPDPMEVYQVLDRYLSESIIILPFICREQLLGDFTSGNQMCCSEALVNAIVGLASAHATIHTPFSSSDFACEAKRLLMVEDNLVSVTGIQTLGVLALAELDRSNINSAWDYMLKCSQNAMLFYLETDHRENPSHNKKHKQVIATTICGAVTLGRMFRLISGCLSLRTEFAFMWMDNQRLDPQDLLLACLERGLAVNEFVTSQIGHFNSVLRFFYIITEHVHAYCMLEYEHAARLTVLFDTYLFCLNAFRLFRDEQLQTADNRSRDGLLASLWYHFCLIALFSRSADHQLGPNDGNSPEDICIRSRDAMLYLAAEYEHISIPEPLPAILSWALSVAKERTFRKPVQHGGLNAEGSTWEPKYCSTKVSFLAG